MSPAPCFMVERETRRRLPRRQERRVCATGTRSGRGRGEAARMVDPSAWHGDTPLREQSRGPPGAADGPSHGFASATREACAGCLLTRA